ISKHLPKCEATLENISDKTALLALQGPKAAEFLQRHVEMPLEAIKYYEFSLGDVAGVPNVYIARTGYTGEDGFELYFPNEHAIKIWKILTSHGDVTP